MRDFGYNQLLGVLCGVACVLFFARSTTRPPTNNLDTVQLDDLLHFIAVHYQFGSADDGLTPDQMTARAANNERLTLTCGWVTEWGVKLLTDAGYKARRVDWLSVKQDVIAGADVGHTNLEVWHPAFGQWIVVDFALGRLYPQTALSLQHQRTMPIPLPVAGALTPDGTLEAWWQHIDDVLIIRAGDGQFYVADTLRKEAVAAYRSELVWVTRDEFLKMFYQ